MGGGSRNYSAHDDDGGAGGGTDICGRKNCNRSNTSGGNSSSSGSGLGRISAASSYCINSNNNNNDGADICKLTTTTAAAVATPATTPTKATSLGVYNSATGARRSPPRARPLRQRIMCRCCLSEQQQPAAISNNNSTSNSSDFDSDLDDTLSVTKFVPLDTLAMIDLYNDGKDAPSFGSGSGMGKRRTSSSSSGSGGGSSSNSCNANSATTLLDCLNACARIGASLADIELPQHICLDCCHTLEMCCEFIRCVRNADKILRRRCALPAKRARLTEALLSPLSSSSSSSLLRSTQQDALLAKRRLRRDEKLQPLQQISGSDRDGCVVAAKSESAANTPNRCPATSLPACGALAQVALTSTNTAHNNNNKSTVLKDISLKRGNTARPTNATFDDLHKCQNIGNKSIKTQSCDKPGKVAMPDDEVDLDFMTLDAEQTFVRSFDSGIEIDEDQHSSKLSDCSSVAEVVGSTTSGSGCHLVEYDGYTYVVAETMSNDLTHFHRSTTRNTVRPSTYKCGFCVFECNAKQELNKHLQQHLGPPQHSCEQCSFACHFKYLLTQHQQSAHRGAVNAKSPQTLMHDAAALVGGEPRYHCHLCPECFVNYDALQQHRKSHKVYCQCTICTFKSSTRENVLEHMAKEHKLLVERRLIVKYIPLQRINSEPMPMEQTQCRTANIVEQHEAKHATSKDNKYRKHLCQFCGKCFDRRFHLLKHEYSVHPLDGLDADSALQSAAAHAKHAKLKYLRQRKAVQAARQQRSIDELVARQQDEHVTSKFECSICAAVFMFNFELKYHMRTHKSGVATVGVAMQDADKKLSSTPLIALSPKERTTELALLGLPDVEHSSEDSNNSNNLISNSVKCVSPAAAAAAAAAASVVDGEKPYVGGEQLDLMALVTQQSSPLNSLDASPTSSNNSYDINYDDQLYLNDFDLGLLDCTVGFPSF